MNKKTGYRPVSNLVRKPSRKALVQGSLITDHATCSSEKEFPVQSKKDDQKKIEATPNVSEFSKVVNHSPKPLHKQVAGCISGQKIVVDSPPTVYITGSGLAEDSNSSDDELCYSYQKKLMEEFNDSSTARPMYCEEKSNSNLFHEALHSSGVKLPKEIAKSVPVPEELASKPLKEIQKKKKTVKVVQSRYRQQSTMAQSKLVKVKSTPSVNVANRSKILKPGSQSNTLKPKLSSKATKSSTPTTDRCKSLFESDVSAIPVAVTSGKVAVSKVENENLSQKTLTMYYSRYLAVTYFNVALQKGSQTKHRTALNDLIKLCDANIVLQQSDLENQVKTLETEQEVEHRLREQSIALGPVTNRISVVSNKYKELAENIDTTRHGLPIKDIVIPSLDSLELSLRQMEMNFKDLEMLTHSHKQNCAEAASSANKLKSTALTEVGNFKVLEKDIDCLNALSIKESNLKLQQETEQKYL